MTFNPTLPSTPFVPNSNNAALIEMWRNNLRKSQVAPSARRPAAEQSAAINVVFDGAGTTPTVGMAGLLEITFPCRIIGCHLYAGNSFAEPATVTATVDLRLSAQGAWASGSSPLWTSLIPTITAAVEADVAVTDWTVDLEPGDLIAFRLASFSGLASWLVVSLPIRRLDLAGTPIAAITDSFGDELVTEDGSTIVLRT